MKKKTEDIIFPFKHRCSSNLPFLADRHQTRLKLHTLEAEALPNTSPSHVSSPESLILLRIDSLDSVSFTVSCHCPLPICLLDFSGFLTSNFASLQSVICAVANHSLIVPCARFLTVFYKNWNFNMKYSTLHHVFPAYLTDFVLGFIGFCMSIMTVLWFPKPVKCVYTQWGTLMYACGGQLEGF